MNWEAIGAIGEIGGSVAVILTLLVLIKQVREGTQATRAATMESIGDRLNERLMIQVENKELASLLIRAEAAKSIDEFEGVEAHQLLMWWTSLFNHHQVQFNQLGLGAVSIDDVNYRRTFLVRRLKNNVVARECWDEGKQNLRSEFVRYVEEALSEAGA